MNSSTKASAHRGSPQGGPRPSDAKEGEWGPGVKGHALRSRQRKTNRRQEDSEAQALGTTWVRQRAGVGGGREPELGAAEGFAGEGSCGSRWENSPPHPPHPPGGEHSPGKSRRQVRVPREHSEGGGGGQRAERPVGTGQPTLGTSQSTLRMPGFTLNSDGRRGGVGVSRPAFRRLPAAGVKRLRGRDLGQGRPDGGGCWGSLVGRLVPQPREEQRWGQTLGCGGGARGRPGDERGEEAGRLQTEPRSGPHAGASGSHPRAAGPLEGGRRRGLRQTGLHRQERVRPAFPRVRRLKRTGSIWLGAELQFHETVKKGKKRRSCLPARFTAQMSSCRRSGSQRVAALSRPLNVPVPCQGALRRAPGSLPVPEGLALFRAEGKPA